MPGSWSDYLELRSGDAPPASVEAGDVRIYADNDGDLRTIKSDGTDAEVGSGGGGSGLILLQHTQLSDAQIKTLPNDGSNLPVTIVDAPASGFLAMPVMVVAIGPEVAYTNIHASCQVEIVTSSFAQVGPVWFQSGGGSVTQLLGQSGARSVAAGMLLTFYTGALGQISAWADGADLSLYDGLPLQITVGNPSGDFTGGDPANKLDLYVYYVVVPTT